METNLTIYVTFEGLGFCCFNPVLQGAEIAFLRLPKHNLEIVVTGDDGRRRIIDRIDDNAKIELVSDEAVVKGFQLNNDGYFDRGTGFGSPNDRSDLRWLLDCEGEELHKRRAVPQENTGYVRGLTGMFLPNAYFYTEQVLAANYEIERKNTADGTMVTEPFGLVGDTLGARIDATHAALKIDGKPVFQFDEGVDPHIVTRFFVNITNTCENPPTAPQSDFHRYYEVMDFQDRLKFDFNVPIHAKRPRPAMCEFVLLSKTKTLAGFF